MITGDVKNQINHIWDSFWSGGISNPMEVIEQITSLLFLRRLDDMHTLEENKANRLKKPMGRRVFPEGKDARGRSCEDFRWSRFKHFAPAEMFTVVGEHVFPYLRTDLTRQLGGAESTYAHHMKDARFTIPTPALLAKVVDLLDKVPMEERDTKGDIYEYMLGKIATAGQNGQFRTPRHIIRLMVELTAGVPEDIFCELYREVARALKAQPSIEALADVIDDPAQSREAFEKTTAADLTGERAVVTFLEAAHAVLDDLGGDEFSNRYFNLLSLLVSSTSSVCATTCGVPAFCTQLCQGYLRASCATCGRSPTRTRTSTRSRRTSRMRYGTCGTTAPTAASRPASRSR